MCNLNELTKNDIEYAVKKYKEIEHNGQLNPKRKSKDYYLLLENKYFPPKYIVAIACDIKSEIEVSYTYKYKFIASEAINILEKLGFIIKKEDNKMSDMISQAIEDFINSLKENNDNVADFGIKMETPKRKDIFYVFRDKKRNIIIKPLNGTAQFPQSIPAIKRYMQHREPTHPVYIQPIGEYIIEKYIKEIPIQVNNTALSSPKSLKNKVKNIILYGSPGVGKTHNTKKLIGLIEIGNSEKEIFETIKNNELNNGLDVEGIKDRIKFVTFHQSFGYEDFIEGFRPNEEGNIELEKGIFLKICKEAEENLLKSGEVIVVPFSDAFNTLFKEKIESEESVTIDLKRAGSHFKVNDYNDKTIYFEKQSGTTKHTLSIATLEKMYNEEKNSSINGGLAVYYEPILDKLLEIKRKSIVDKIERKNYYLVIDEINRGNISKIFGELITLIEEDKRDTLEATLPYSKQTFKIPSNLYIIGTMNSTDKSIALIDIALRRRFTFLKMEPKLDLVKNDKAQYIMKQLNEIITDTLGADYVLGHSYFMKIKNEDDLEFVLEYKIKPLLEEYFYGDIDGLHSIMKIVEDLNE